MTKRAFLSVASTAVALVVAGCGGASHGSGAGNAPSAGKADGAPAASGGAALRVITDPKLGKIIVDAKGRTLYDFVIDKGTTSVCYGACASLWPPYTTNGRPVAGQNVMPTLIGTTKRRDGSSEVTYAGHPLYYYAQDSSPGDTNGEGSTNFGAEWTIVAPDGSSIEKSGTSGDDSSPSRGSYY
jgi:predicted lipoprotein with Yx(FWY)xxD motif